MSKDTMEKKPAAAGASDQTQKLDDEQRVKVLSPSMLVFKRFIRNKLAITGFIILVVMFAFSFLGGLITPYSQSELFRKYEAMETEYASVTQNDELRYVVANGASFDKADYAKLILAINKGETSFESNGTVFSYLQLDDATYKIVTLQPSANVLTKKGLSVVTPLEGVTLPEGFNDAFKQANDAGQTTFMMDDLEFTIVKNGKTTQISTAQPVALASKRIFDSYNPENSAMVSGYAFRAAAESAIAAGESTFRYEDADYQLAEDDGNVIVNQGETSVAYVSRTIVNAASSDVFLTVEYKAAVREAIGAGEKKFTFAGADGKEANYSINLVKNTYTVKTETQTMLLDTYAAPSKTHLLGTDSHGMDVLTRLMYGGRISLLVGFVVVFIEMFIGIIVGGISGYFGKWVDSLLMRFVDLFNCIPYWPMMIIAGSVMDSVEVPATYRIFLLMLIMGIMGWTGIARVVRGQILALREQDFMVATEATGIRVSRRIFRHLVPNVMPLLIVQATMGLGSIIITEATLSFLGLGVKYPLASWGSIINEATNVFVMTNYPFIWIPAGILIFTTVLGFNFVGDGLRDAFDPKMKR